MKILIMSTRTCYIKRKNDEDYFTEIEGAPIRAGHEWDNDLICYQIEKEAILDFNGICDIQPIVLSETLRNWLKENNVLYKASLDCKCEFDDDEECKGVDWYIDIFDDDKALLFKLTWG